MWKKSFNLIKVTDTHNTYEDFLYYSNYFQCCSWHSRSSGNRSLGHDIEKANQLQIAQRGVWLTLSGPKRRKTCSELFSWPQDPAKMSFDGMDVEIREIRCKNEKMCRWLPRSPSLVKPQWCTIPPHRCSAPITKKEKNPSPLWPSHAWVRGSVTKVVLVLQLRLYFQSQGKWGEWLGFCKIW